MISGSDSATLFVLNNDTASKKDFNVTDVQVKNSASWIVMVSPESGLVPMDDSLGISIMIDTTGMLPGTYEDTLLISTDADLSKAVTLQVPVRLILSGALMSKNISLSAYEHNGAVLLNWFNPYDSEVLISRDSGGSESVIDRVFVSRGSNTYTDYSPLDGNSYYKIGIMNGNTVEWTGPVKVSMTGYSDLLFAETVRGNTLLKYSIQDNTNVSISIYDITGREVRTLLSKNMNRGAYSMTWDQKDNGGNSIMSGIYFIRMNTDNGSFTAKTYILE